jgi:hypothetical protein
MTVMLLLVVLVISLLLIQSNRQTRRTNDQLGKALVRSHISEINLKLLTLTLNQLGHLIPDIIMGLKDQVSNIPVPMIQKSLESLGFHTRKIYKLALPIEENSEINSLSPIEIELNACIELMNLNYLVGQELDSRDLIKLINFNPARVKLPVFVLSNLIMNAFKHGELTINRDKTGRTKNYGCLQIIQEEDEGYSNYSFINDALGSPKDLNAKGTGLSFIKSVISDWNNIKTNTKFESGYKVIENKNYFYVSFNATTRN